MEFDITKAAHERARNMANIYKKYGDNGEILKLVNRKTGIGTRISGLIVEKLRVFPGIFWASPGGYSGCG